MTKWWILSVVFVVWIGVGHALFDSAPAQTLLDRRDAGVPQRIVSTAPNLTEILFALGLDARIVGVTQDSDYPPAARQKRQIGSFWQPNVEAVIAVRPDLTVTLSFEQQRSLANRLTRMGYNCLTVGIWTVEDLFGAIARLGQATGTEHRADRLIDEMTMKIEALQRVLAGRDTVRVLWVMQRDPLRVAGRDTFINELIELAGGENAIGPTFHKYPAIGGEQVVASRADVIIEPTMAGGAPDRHRAEAVAYWSRFANVPAVADGRIHVIDGDLVSRLGPRLGEAVTMIATCLRPDVLGE
jgi:iron complex transport system substrate-binding protein